MQTLTIGRSTYKLSPHRNVGELQAKLSKFTGKTKKTIIAKERRSYPIFKTGQSTSEYVNSFYELNDLGALHMYGPLNTEPCILYSGADLHETLTDENDCAQESTTVAQDALPIEPAPADDVPSPVEPMAPVAADPDLIAPDTLREMNRAHGIASEQIRAIRSYCLAHPGSHVADMLRAEADRYGRRSDEHETSDAWARIYRQISDELGAAAEFLVEPEPTPPNPIRPATPSALYDKFVYAKWTGLPVGGYYALRPDGTTTLKDTPDGTMPRRFKTIEAADAYARKHHRRLVRIARKAPTVTPLPRVLYSEFIRSASKREAPMTA